MYYELESGTDVALHVLYDPASTGHLRTDAFVGDDWIRESGLGNLLYYDVASDGRTMFRVYVDEPIPDEFRRKAEATTENLLLKLPSGVLVASGMEYLNAESVIKNAKSFQPGESELTTKVQIQPGIYLVDAYEIDWDWDAEIAPIIEKETGNSLKRENLFGPILGCGGFGAIILSIVLIVSCFVDGWSLVKFAWLGIPVFFLVVGFLGFKLFIPEDYFRKKDEIAARFPPNVLVLKRLPDDADISKFRGGGLGFAARERRATK